MSHLPLFRDELLLARIENTIPDGARYCETCGYLAVLTVDGWTHLFHEDTHPVKRPAPGPACDPAPVPPATKPDDARVTTIAVSPQVQVVVTAGHAGTDQVGLTLRGPHTSITVALPAPLVDALGEALAAAAPVPYEPVAGEVWSDAVAPGGWVCAVCATPVESEPCPDHGPALPETPCGTCGRSGEDYAAGWDAGAATTAREIGRAEQIIARATAAIEGGE